MENENATDIEWGNFLKTMGKLDIGALSTTPIKEKTKTDTIKLLIPEPVAYADLVCEELYISTKTKVLYLNQPIDIHRIFWLLPIVEYWQQKEGIIKKQMKIVSKSKEEFEAYQARLTNIPYYRDYVIKQIDNPMARRIKFKDERKLTVGLSKKDIMNCRSKQKNAFYNCFAMILRFYCGGEYKEIHVKVFNTGKLEIPGILNNALLVTVQRMVLEILSPHMDKDVPLFYISEERGDENVLINSNFNCGFYVNRDNIHSILRSEKYGIESAYDPCSYPGVKCKFYFNHAWGFDEEKQRGQVTFADRQMKMSELGDSKTYTEISFMIFRTGSCLIVGNCSEPILMFVFEFIKRFLIAEHDNIRVSNEGPVNKSKKTKIRKRSIKMTSEYFKEISK